MINTRNDKVTDALRRIYERNVRTIFCVSNMLYQDIRDESFDCGAPMPWLLLSGIISLRKHCLGLVAEHQLQAANTFMKEAMPELVLSIDLWVKSGSERIATETRNQVREASMEVERILQRVKLTLGTLRQTIRADYCIGIRRSLAEQQSIV